ncbi:MAG: acetylxylan esterase [Bryobacterales bacterium]|nr:acetylxylan esterase [Bryobacterales bacterium]
MTRLACCLLASIGALAGQNNNSMSGPAEYEALQAHFERVIEARQQRLFGAANSAAAWQSRKPQIRAALERMLWHGLQLPETPPRVTITHRVEHAAYTIENIVLESAPQLYSTSNLYLPRTGSKPYPVILYQCGHANKHYYKRHGAWFAQQGIAVLVLDNIEMGEAEFTHHGVYSNAWFHWYSRGFSPLAVELLNARRALDYLVTRPDLDSKRIGATGRSGGGMATFFLAALDERVRASAPVSGTLSTEGWVKQRLSFAHCDCQYPVNRYGLLYSEIGALIAPRPHLQANAESDPGFPMNAFRDLIAKMGIVYRLYNATGALETATAPGGHQDIEAVRLPVYSFFLRELLGRSLPVTSEGVIDEPSDEQLVCHRSGLPADDRLSRIDESLLPEPAAPSSAKALADTLRKEVFAYFPQTGAPLDPVWSRSETAQGRTTRRVSFTGLEGLRVKAVFSLPAGPSAPAALPALLVADHRRGIPVWGNEQPLERNQWGERAVLLVETLDRGSRALERNLRSYSDNDALHHMKRQAMIAGATIESIQVYELLRALSLLRSQPEVDVARLAITGSGEMGVNALYVAMLDGAVERIILHSPTASHRSGPHYLGVLRFTDIPQTIGLLGSKVRVYGEPPHGIASGCASLLECLQ